MLDEKPTLDYRGPEQRSLLAGCLITVTVYLGIVFVILSTMVLIIYMGLHK